MVVNPGTDQESIRVMDFGFAGFSAKPHIQLAELTGQGPIFACGTPAYVSPEMIRGDATDARADIYSVGVILFELLTGRLPFDYEDQQELLTAHLRETPPKFFQLGVRHIPPLVEAVVQHALCKYPSERPQSMKELAAAFSRGLGWDIWDATEPPRGEPDEETIELTVAEAPNNTTSNPMLDRFVLSDQFQACLPEKLAAIKLRAFIEEVAGQVVSSEPGHIQVRIDLPKGYKEPSSRSGLFNFLAGSRNAVAGKEPIELELEMQKLDANMVLVQIVFKPMPEFLPSNEKRWAERCEGVYSILRRYIMPQDGN
jgi:serine/threonine protein kinase